jgi:DNA invertase Pin-like site-specific DNA recombinase
MVPRRAGLSGFFILIDDDGQQMMAVFAEFARAVIRDRVKAGLERDRAEARRWAGRPSVARPMPRSARR